MSFPVGCLKVSRYHHRSFLRLVTPRSGSVGQNEVSTVFPSLEKLALQCILQVNAKAKECALLTELKDLEKNIIVLQKPNDTGRCN